MKISSKEKTALKVMIYLASHYDEKRYISLKEISEKEDISLKYLEKIMILLNKDKKLDVLRGKNGGYKLKYDPKEYTIYDILKNVEEDIDKSQCDKSGWLIMENSNTLVLTGLALLNLYTSL